MPTPTLLSLPPEILDMIYGYVLRRDKPIFLQLGTLRREHRQINRVRNSTVKLDWDNADAFLDPTSLADNMKNLDKPETDPAASCSSTHTSILRVSKAVHRRTAIRLIQVNEIVVIGLGPQHHVRVIPTNPFGVTAVRGPLLDGVAHHATRLTFWMEANEPMEVSVAFMEYILSCTGTLRRLRVFFKLPQSPEEKNHWSTFWSSPFSVDFFRRAMTREVIKGVEVEIGYFDNLAMALM